MQNIQSDYGVPLAAKGLLHLGSSAAVDQTLSRLAARGELKRDAVQDKDVGQFFTPPELSEMMAQMCKLHAAIVTKSLKTS